MAMIPMKRLQVVILENQREVFLKQLMLLGCVELTESHPPEAVPWLEKWLKADEGNLQEITAQQSLLQDALISINKHLKPLKSKLFPELKSLSLEQVEDTSLLQQAIEQSQAILALQNELQTLSREEEQWVASAQFLSPWQGLTLPLEVGSTQHVTIYMGVCPFAVNLADFTQQLNNSLSEVQLTIVHSDKEQHYLWLMIHKQFERALEEQLTQIGFSRVTFKDMQGTATDNYEATELNIQRVQGEIKALKARFENLRDWKENIETCLDGLSLKHTREAMRMRLLRSQRTLYIEGWLPEDSLPHVAKAFSSLDCAYSFSDPSLEEEPPVAFKNNLIFAPFGIISSLYGTPRYSSVIDPTPFMAPFFFVFFGMMMSDGAYGIIMTLLAIWVLRHQQQKGFVKQLFTLVFFCGLSTILWGALFGSWFGDFIPTVTKTFTGTAYTIEPLWFDPLKKPMDMLVFSFSLGALQVLVGLGLSGWRKIRQGCWLDAVYDVVFWYLILFGLVLGLFKIPFSLEMAACGAVGVIFTAGRSEKNLLKRLMSGILSLYAVTGYLADVLSYSRLLALGLASGVIASVVNGISVIGGNSFIGIISLVLIFTIGHLFNLAINLVGAYVHASRLQYVEFFSKFFESGGIPFQPLTTVTQYVHVKTENTSNQENE